MSGSHPVEEFVLLGLERSDRVDQMAAVRIHRCSVLGCPPMLGRGAHDTDRCVDTEVVGVVAEIHRLLVGQAQLVAQFAQTHTDAP
jgi:hypothetical protein